MTDKKFIILSIPLLITIFILLMIFNFYFYKIPFGTLWIHNSFIKKDNYAKSIQNTKIVFTSGSNTLFGMETNIIEKELNIPTVNMAIQGGLKTEYILYRTKNILKTGDIVVLPMEYQNLTWNGNIEETYRDYVLTYDKNYFNNMPIKEQLSFLFSITPYKLVKSSIDKKRTLIEPEMEKTYNSNTLNKNGDVIYKEGTKTGFKTIPFELPNPYNIETYGLLKIKEFAKWCEDNKIKLLVSFPNTVNLKEYYDKPYTNYFNFLINYFEKNNIQVIGKPTDSLYPIQYFYDTDYHLNNYGAKIRTYKFLEELKKVLY
ncbi:hypothetical protein [Aliarcobacter butzleri]|uniref:hypothetical protein n=1 Tax=Aliarcobacter butzleri TaxID=28197 RepID=UPI00344B3966